MLFTLLTMNVLFNNQQNVLKLTARADKAMLT